MELQYKYVDLMQKLSQQLLRSESSQDDALKISRLLRPTNSDVLTHSDAVKTRLRKLLLSKYGEFSGGPSAVMDFDREIDSLRRMHSNNWQAFLAIIEPLTIQMSLQTNPGKDFAVPSTKARIDTTGVHSQESASSTSIPLNVPRHLSTAELELMNQNTIWVSPVIELILLRDLLLVFQGINGKYVKLEERSQAYIIDPSLSLPSSTRDIVLCLCEVGWLFSRIDCYVRMVDKAESKGLMAQALGHSLQDAFQDYYRLLAVIEQELSRIKSSVDFPTTVSDNGDTNKLSLLRLRVWMQEPLERLILMARIVDAAAPLQGGGLVSRLHGHTFHGDVRVESFVSSSIMRSVCVPLYKMITRWVLHGELKDPYREFFIATAGSGARFDQFDSSSADFVWHSYYSLQSSMLPAFIPHKLATKILVVGKSINFMKACVRHGGNEEGGARVGRESKSIVDVPEKDQESDSSGVVLSLSSKFEKSLQSLQYGHELELESAVYSVATVIETRLLQLVHNKFHLSTHLSALKKFLLLGQGDFVTCLMDNIGGELKRRANQLFRHNLTGSLRSCNAQFEPAFVLDRLGVRLLEPSSGDTGWEIFSLDYAIDAPIASVVHTSAVSKYRMAFHMLWRLKRVEWTLSGSWRTLVSFLHTRGHFNLTRLKPIMHRCALERGKMTHLVNNLNNFFMFEVVESAWRELEAGVANATCLDDIIDVHDHYLNQIQDRALLSEQHETLNMQIQQVIQAILRFCSLEEALVSDALSVAVKRNYESNVGWSGKPEPGLVQDEPGKIDGVPGYIVSRLEEAAQNYESQYHKLIKMLQDQGERAGDFARYLSFHLDLNIFGPVNSPKPMDDHLFGGESRESVKSQDGDALPIKHRRPDTTAAERAIRAEDIDAGRPLLRETKPAARHATAPQTTHGTDGHRHTKPFR